MSGDCNPGVRPTPRQGMLGPPLTSLGNGGRLSGAGQTSHRLRILFSPLASHRSASATELGLTARHIERNQRAGLTQDTQGPFTKQSSIADGNELGLAWNDDESGRLPLRTAFPLILLLSLSCWALVLTFMMWLIRRVI